VVAFSADHPGYDVDSRGLILALLAFRRDPPDRGWTFADRSADNPDGRTGSLLSFAVAPQKTHTTIRSLSSLDCSCPDVKP